MSGNTQIVTLLPYYKALASEALVATYSLRLRRKRVANSPLQEVLTKRRLKLPNEAISPEPSFLSARMIASLQHHYSQPDESACGIGVVTSPLPRLCPPRLSSIELNSEVIFIN